MVAALALVAFFIASPLLLNRQWRLFFAVPVSVLQLYLPGAGIGGFMPPLALLGGLALWPEFIRGIQILLRWPPTLMLIGILLMYGFSLLWSVDVRMGFREIIYLWVFLAIFSAIVLQLRRDERVVWRLLALTVLLAMVEALLVVFFRVNPSLEMVFLHSDLARLFVNPNVLDVLFTTGMNNVLDPVKAGGLFVNGNVAGAYLWLIAMVAALLGSRKKNRSMFVVSGFILIAAFFTGSKTVLLLAALLIPTLLVMLFWNSRMRAVWFAIFFLTIGVIGAAGLLSSQFVDRPSVETHGSLFEQSDSALSTRVKIWGYAFQAFCETPFLGQGFGGWQQSYSNYAGSFNEYQVFPPHNTWIYLWSQSGLLSAMFGMAFVILVVRFGVRWLSSLHSQRIMVMVSMLGAYIWTFVHGMGTNFGLVGDAHMTPILAVLLALAYSCIDERRRWQLA